jgi:hypothetical protein
MNSEPSYILTLIVFLKDWIIPIGAVVISVWFASSAKNDSDRAQSILSQIKDAVEGSQRKMIESATGILDSLPQVMTGKAILSITHAIELTLDTIKENISNPKGLPKDEHDQNILALSSHLNMLLEQLKSFSNSK